MDEQQQGHSAGPHRDVCIHNNLKAKGIISSVQLSGDVVCVALASGSQIHILRQTRRSLSSCDVRTKPGSKNPLSKNANIIILHVFVSNCAHAHPYTAEQIKRLVDIQKINHLFELSNNCLSYYFHPGASHFRPCPFVCLLGGRLFFLTINRKCWASETDYKNNHISFSLNIHFDYILLCFSFLLLF